MSKIDTNPDHLRRSGNKLTEFGDKISQGGQKMETAGQNLVSHASGDRSGFGAVISKAMGRGMEVAGKVFKEGGRVASKAGSHLVKTGDLHEGADIAGRDGLLKHEKTAKNPHVTGSSSGTGTHSGSSHSGGGKDKEPPKLPTGGGDKGSGHTTPSGAGGGGKDKEPPKLPGSSGGGDKGGGAKGGGDTHHMSGDLRLVRQDDEFTSPVSSKFGLKKSHIDEHGNLVPANPDGKTEPWQHVLGGKDKVAKENSPFTSFSVKDNTGKVYGKQEISVDVGKLHSDIQSGKVHGVEVLQPHQVQASLQNQIDGIAGKPVHVSLPHDAKPEEVKQFVDDLGLSKGKSNKLLGRVQGLLNTSRDNEWLIKGKIPSEYIKGPYDVS